MLMVTHESASATLRLTRWDSWVAFMCIYDSKLILNLGGKQVLKINGDGPEWHIFKGVFRC